ncbi:single-stranded DNA-binding protein [Spiroplasma endosymbiont of Danaus chrysippus]|uniref:single-stranded DNA-binding protein n=1 Tax=Spiroplasma endosymbiont of Danaus chrysippus TaxID=2691041 RepID=UPI0013C58171|nr:single-stranded DNA-binding protein [Spiroplasma endosymbiont of Danaus chrysippus]CAB1054913.1 Single-stranded DNA-binding protein [Spiroplasma endosymbiont of Danaus chrysippus]
MNKVILIGRLARDLKLYKTQSEKPFTFFTIAVNNISNQADFISCVAWNKVAEKMCEYLGKGSLISLSGRLSVRKIINQEKKEQYITEVVAENVTFLDYRKQEKNLNNANIENSALATDKKIDLDSAFKNFNYNLNNSGIENLYENNDLDFNEEVIVWDN